GRGGDVERVRARGDRGHGHACEVRVARAVSPVDGHLIRLPRRETGVGEQADEQPARGRQARGGRGPEAPQGQRRGRTGHGGGAAGGGGGGGATVTVVLIVVDWPSSSATEITTFLVPAVA